MIEFSKRHDGLFNVWAMLRGVEGWTIVGVHTAYHDALRQMREMQTERRVSRA